MNVSATSVAALGTAGGPTPPGTVNAPFGISEDWFNGVAQCGSEIKFHPTSTAGCAGWHNFDEGSHSASAIKSTIDGIADGSFVSPEIIPGVTQFTFSGGNIASAFPNLQALYNQEAVAGDWYVTIPVYEANGCANPSNMMTIVGYAKAKVTAILGPPAKTIKSEVQCDSFVNGAPPTGSGGVSGPGTPISPYPRLVS